MKYIRTKDGKIVNRLNNWHLFKSHGLTGKYIIRSLENDNDLELWLEYNRTSIIKQTDTIEELCDEFVDIDNHDYYKISHKNGITYALSKTKRFLGNYDIRCKEIGQIMGAIWTDKGLIYVTKMNEKGELELL